MVPFTEGSLELAPGVPGALSCPVLVVPVASLPDRALCGFWGLRGLRVRDRRKGHQHQDHTCARD